MLDRRFEKYQVACAKLLEGTQKKKVEHSIEIGQLLVEGLKKFVEPDLYGFKINTSRIYSPDSYEKHLQTTRQNIQAFDVFRGRIRTKKACFNSNSEKFTHALGAAFECVFQQTAGVCDHTRAEIKTTMKADPDYFSVKTVRRDMQELGALLDGKSASPAGGGSGAPATDFLARAGAGGSGGGPADLAAALDAQNHRAATVAGRKPSNRLKRGRE